MVRLPHPLSSCLLLLALSTGCAPERFSFAGIHRVVDAESGLGVQGAELEALVNDTPSGEVIAVLPGGVLHYEFHFEREGLTARSFTFELRAPGYRSQVLPGSDFQAHVPAPIQMLRE